MPHTSTKPTCDAQASRPCADCAEPKRKQSRPPADPLDFRRASFTALGHDPDLACQLTAAEFRALYALFKRAAAARKERAR